MRFLSKFGLSLTKLSCWHNSLHKWVVLVWIWLQRILSLQLRGWWLKLILVLLSSSCRWTGYLLCLVNSHLQQMVKRLVVHRFDRATYALLIPSEISIGLSWKLRFRLRFTVSEGCSICRTGKTSCKVLAHSVLRIKVLYELAMLLLLSFQLWKGSRR